ncbi:hypothetical protein Mtai_v1c15540 [Meiothermus taiwanensis WR-220]|jgi:hypothetical protein|uniref:Uncharacterized protein n=2 Tax=Meiothermus taiwanensis TaxID=172827 RepID=A0A399EAI6_9DEIN|nr:hypothetical protein Mtai_v1c15540 [Meiothermus taiwanensis WR-220]RIH79032.1 hypothetical protein Mcate_00545 [Meiothermus taiwanensis]
MTLRLPEPLLAEPVEMPASQPEAPRQVEAVPLGPDELDPVVTQAVESQPEVSMPKAGAVENEKVSEEKAETARPAPKPIQGYAVAVLGAVLVVAAAVLGMKGGTGATTPCGNCGGNRTGGSAVSGSGPIIY